MPEPTPEATNRWRDLLNRFGLPGVSQLFEKSGIATRLLGIDSALLQTFLGFASSYLGIISIDFLVEKVGGWLGTPLTPAERKELEQILEGIQRERGKLLAEKIPPLSLEENGKFFSKVFLLSESVRERFLSRYSAFSPEHQAAITRLVNMFDSDLSTLVNDETTWMVFISQVDAMIQKKEDKDRPGFSKWAGDLMKQGAGYVSDVHTHLVGDTTLQLKAREAELHRRQKNIKQRWEEETKKRIRRRLGNPFSLRRVIELWEDWDSLSKQEKVIRVYELLGFPLLVVSVAVATYIYTHK